MVSKFDVIVVGAGPAGSSAAIMAAKAGLKVLVIERGEYVGAKNMTGGMLLAQVLNEVIPEFWEEAPLQRPIVSQRIMMASGARSMMVDISNQKFKEPPFNGFSVLRHEFDAWLADKAREAGAIVVTGTVVDDVIREGDRIVGVKTRREDGDVYGDVVILADGVNSLLARKVGLKKPDKAHDIGLGVKELLALPAKTINERFGLTGNSGAAFMAIGDFARGIPGGGFIYTNKESLSIGMVLQPQALIDQKVTADEVLERFKSRPEVARLIEGGKLIEYSGHLIPEGGYKSMSGLVADGIMVAGDAAGFVVNTGITLQGMNLAIASGKCAGEAAVKAWQKRDFSAAALSEYEKLLSEGVALNAMKTHSRAPELMSSSRMFSEYPDMINDLLEQVLTVGSGPQELLMNIARREIKKIGWMNVIHDGMTGVKSL
ncbi:Protein FixC [Desulfitobacterium hafniense]|uniref:Protein FixC n=1 Tax=Desulfitobacterium hafniense TaxID=49338 RepID=A0A098B6H8_DESHA|nr:FAD-dependent oxidoreductase [Desulfitobacterium hafniense]CDX03962.1 Protein FixC [Desulfitobacterium hafniense]